MIGDDYTMVMHCENVEDTAGYEPDAGPIYCNYPNNEVIIFDADYDSLSDDTKKMVDGQAKRLRELAGREGDKK